MRPAILLLSVLCCLPVAAEEAPDNVFLPVLTEDSPADVAAEVSPVTAETLPADTPELLPAVVESAEIPSPVTQLVSSRYMGQAQVHTADELLALLSRAERISSGLDEYSTTEPVALVLSGEEIDLFKRENYRKNKALVDLAARLDAFNIVDIKVCKYWMYQRGIDTRDLPPFVETVPEAEQEVKRLQKAGYVSF